MIKSLKTHALFAGLIVGLLVLSGCVTTTDSPKTKINVQEALEANVQLGMTYLQKGDRENALRAFSKALETDSKSAEAHQGMALVHQINGETDAAEKSFKRALKGRADFSMSGVELSYGRFLYEQERFDEAKAHFEIASEDLTFKSRANALYYVGLASQKIGDEVRAAAAFQHSLNLNPRLAPAAIELAEYSFVKRDYTETKKYLDLFVRINNRQTARSLWLGIRIERIFGNKDKEASYSLALKNLYPYSKEYLEYKNLIEMNESK